MVSLFMSLNEIKFNFSLSYSPRKKVYSSSLGNCRECNERARQGEFANNHQPRNAIVNAVITTVQIREAFHRAPAILPAERSPICIGTHVARTQWAAAWLHALARICTITSHLATRLLPYHRRGECIQECYNAIAISWSRFDYSNVSTPLSCIRDSKNVHYNFF